VRAQVRRTGIAVVAGPVLAGAAVAAAGLGASLVLPAEHTMLLVSWLVQAFVLCAGVCVAASVTGDTLVELHESTPTPFRAVQVLRSGIVNVAAVIGAVVMYVPLRRTGVWPRDEGWSSLFSPVGAVVVITVVALTAAAFSGTPVTATIAVVVAWMFLVTVWDPHVLPLHLQRGLPLIAALVPAVSAWRRLADTERNVLRAVA
jgi:cytochrome bd-type quinol oxidase subunit 2